AKWSTDVGAIESKFDGVTRREVSQLLAEALQSEGAAYSIDVTTLPNCRAEVLDAGQLSTTLALGAPPPAVAPAPGGDPDPRWDHIGVGAAGVLVLCALAGGAGVLYAGRRGWSRPPSCPRARAYKGRSAALEAPRPPEWTLERLALEVRGPSRGLPLEALPALQELLAEYSLVHPWPDHKQGGQSIIASAVHRGSLNQSLLKIAPRKDVEKERTVSARLQRIGKSLVEESKVIQEARAFIAMLKDSRVNPESSPYPFGMLCLDEGSGNLTDVLRSASEGTITNDMKRPVLVNCVNVVLFLHECGIGWGDCAPSNFVAFKVTSLMGDLFQYRAIDFGSAVLLPDVQGSQEEEHRLPRYHSPDDAVQVGFCAPERLAAIQNRQRLPAADSVDIWALGCIAFFVLAGRPLMGETEDECAANLLVSQGTGLNTEFMVNPELQAYVE
ncbi:unnamed protein product, partial [Prorocentrum cordatum]